MYLSVCYVVPLVYVLLFVTYVVMYLFIKRLQLHHQRDLRLQHTILNKEIIHKTCSMTRTLTVYLFALKKGCSKILAIRILTYRSYRGYRGHRSYSLRLRTSKSNKKCHTKM